MIVLATSGAPVAENDALHRVWRGEGRTENVAGPLTVLSWNIERGLNLEGVAAVLQEQAPQLALLQEVDVNARRSGRHNVAESLAARLQMRWAYAVEFQELGQGVDSPAYVGQAVLSRLPIRTARILRFKEQSDFWRPRWFVPNWSAFQRRLGGRIALVAELDWNGRSLLIYNAHLESRGAENRRVEQMEEILADAAKYSPDTPTVIAGDFNTVLRPSPVISRLRQAGFRQAAGSEESTSARGAALDWIFVRGTLDFQEGRVLSEAKASDHYPLRVRLSTGR